MGCHEVKNNQCPHTYARRKNGILPHDNTIKRKKRGKRIKSG